MEDVRVAKDLVGAALINDGGAIGVCRRAIRARQWLTCEYGNDPLRLGKGKNEGREKCYGKKRKEGWRACMKF